MTRSQMIETVARKTGFPESQVETTMDAMFDQIAECLRADEKVTIAGFGRFEMRPRKPKAYTNPKTKVSSRLEPTPIPGFKASGRFKQKLEAARAAAAADKAMEETAYPPIRQGRTRQAPGLFLFPADILSAACYTDIIMAYCRKIPARPGAGCKAAGAAGAPQSAVQNARRTPHLE